MIVQAVILSPLFMFAEVAQLVEHATENCGVPSSSLGLGTPAAVGGSSNWQDRGLWIL